MSNKRERLIQNHPLANKQFEKTIERAIVRSRLQSPLQNAVARLIKKMNSDKDYRRGWKDNIAMAYKDRYHQYKKEKKKKVLSRGDIHIVANQAAEHFLWLLCSDVKKSKKK